ncbi:MAG: DEAD/DEAH box helicase family protein [Pseudonocardia sp.]
MADTVIENPILNRPYDEPPATQIQPNPLVNRIREHVTLWVRNHLDTLNDELNRVACKMATGTGKTVVIAMLIAW